MKFELDHKHKRILELIDPKKTDKILVIGTGVFPKVEYFLNKIHKCKNIISGDIDQNNIDMAKAALPELNFIYLDAQKKLPFKNRSFDKVILTDVLEHLPKERLILDEIYRITKTTGAFIITVPKRRWFNVFSPITHIQHVREYYETRLTKILKIVGFKVKKVIVGGSPLNLLGLWIHLILKYAFRYTHTKIFFDKRIGVA